VAEFDLTARPALGGIRLAYGRLTIAEVTDLAIVSVATPNGGAAALAAAVEAAYATALPAVGRSTRSNVDDVRILGLAPDQCFLIFRLAEPFAVGQVRDRLGEAAYLTDQSDSWAALQVSGSDSRAVLERICPVDLHPAAFAEGHVTRTVMEHLGVIILCQGEDDYLLLSARSSAASFLHAVQTSAENTA